MRYGPSFVILGIDAGQDGQVTIYASRHLINAEISLECAPMAPSMWDPTVAVAADYKARIATEMIDLVQARGATFAEAFARLFGVWSADQPKPAARPAIRPVRPQIEGPQ